MDIATWHQETIAQRTVESLKKNLFDAVYCSSRKEAVEKVLGYVSAGDSVSFGGSLTLNQLNLPELIKNKGGKIIERNTTTPEENFEALRKQLLSDVYMSSTNAVTMDGFLVNIDGVGNRIAAITFGPKKVVIVVGVNKICIDEAAAWERLKNVAAPMNMKRLKKETPCAVTGTCADCRSEARGCRIYSVLKRKPMLSDITVVIVGENLGY